MNDTRELMVHYAACDAGTALSGLCFHLRANARQHYNYTIAEAVAAVINEVIAEDAGDYPFEVY